MSQGMTPRVMRDIHVDELGEIAVTDKRILLILAMDSYAV